MFCPSSSSVSPPRGAHLGKVGATSVCASANLIADDIDDIDSSNAVDAMAFLQQTSFQIDDHGEMVDDDLFFDLFDEDMNSADEEPSASARKYDHIPPPPPRTSGRTHVKTSKDNRRSSMPGRLPSHKTMAKIRSLEAQLAETMHRTNISRAVVLGSRRHSSCSVPVSHASSTASTASTSASTASTISSSSSSTTSSVAIHPKRIASTEAFLAGKRSTLTPALEQSRRQLQMYMEQLDMSM